MLPVDYCYCHMCQARVDVRSCVSSVCYSLNTPFVTILVSSFLDPRVQHRDKAEDVLGHLIAVKKCIISIHL